MAKKTVNTKVEAANNRKSASKSERESQKKAELEALEDAKWAKGAKKNDKKLAEAEKKAAALEKKLEAKKLLEEEENSLKKVKAPKPNYTKKFEYNPNKKSAASKAASKAAAMASKKEDNVEESETSSKKILSEKDIEKHPERRFKTALKEFEERELKNYRSEYPGLRLSQLKEIMYKDFQKSADNPFNQSNVFSYNTSLEEVNRKLYGEPEPKEEKEDEEESEDEENETQASSDVAAPKQAVASY